jgi:hypothetical protein
VSLEALERRLARFAQGAHRPAALAAAARAHQDVVDGVTADHVDTGNMRRTARVVVTPDGVEVQGPRYMPFVRGLDRDALRRVDVEPYLEVCRRELVG